MKLLVAPPGGGKTRFLVAEARGAAQAGARVWWLGLPSQRAYVYRRLTEAGALLGVEFLSSQQLYYRLLAHALRLKPLLVGTGRLALVGQALAQLRGELPAPGEARLFAQAIAEAKRFGLSWREIGRDAGREDPEVRRLREVFRVYEALKGERWDYDDFRSEALRYAEGGSGPLEPDLIVVDGLREVGPLELRIYRALGARLPLWLALPAEPPGLAPTLELPPRALSAPQVYRSSNPVSEARWVLRALKRDLAAGLDPLELAVILPERMSRAFVALADEYGVPIMDETPKALAESVLGRLLLALLELADYPTPSRLLAIPELQGLARAALERGVAGAEAIGELARGLGLGASWRKWLALLEVPEDELAWAASLLDTSLLELRPDLGEAAPPWPMFREAALQRAKEASALARGASFRKWWAALLQETQVFAQPRGGVALLSDKLASGRRFRRAYLMHALEGSYSAGEAEDYFVPEEGRAALQRVFDDLGLPRRFQGRDARLFDELRARADTVVITYAEADQGGPLEPSADLLRLAAAAPPLPELPAASRLELGAPPVPVVADSPARPIDLGRPTLERLRRYEDCAFRLWAEDRLPPEAAPRWLELLGELKLHPRLNRARLEALAERFPEAAPWLAAQAERLLALQYGAVLPEEAQNAPYGGGPQARLDAVERSGDEVALYRFVAPGRVQDAQSAARYLENERWSELWAAGYLLGRYRGRIRRVALFVWPVGSEPVAAYNGGVRSVWRRIETRQRRAEAVLARFERGEVEPNPGFRCRSCRLADLCRAAER